jgi:hypothetical protein
MQTKPLRLAASVAHLCTRQDDLAGDEDKQHDLWLEHAVDQAGEQLGLVLNMGCGSMRVQRTRASSRPYAAGRGRLLDAPTQPYAGLVGRVGNTIQAPGPACHIHIQTQSRRGRRQGLRA